MLPDCNLDSPLEENFNNPLQFLVSFRPQCNTCKAGCLLSFISFRVNQLCHQQVRRSKVNGWEKETRDDSSPQTTGPWNGPLCRAWWRLTDMHVSRDPRLYCGGAYRTSWHQLIRKPLNLFQPNLSCARIASNLEKLRGGMEKHQEEYIIFRPHLSSWTRTSIQPGGARVTTKPDMR